MNTDFTTSQNSLKLTLELLFLTLELLIFLPKTEVQCSRALSGKGSDLFYGSAAPCNTLLFHANAAPLVLNHKTA